MNNVINLSVYREKQLVKSMSTLERINYLIEKTTRELAKIKQQIDTK